MNETRLESPARPDEASEAAMPRCSTAGITMVEVIIILAVVSILALIIMPRAICLLEKSHMAKAVSELSHARDTIEAYELELGQWPASLDDAFGGRPLPKDFVYCSAGNDANKGHGNERCTFFDSGNPSGKNQHGGSPGVGYILATPPALAAKCAHVNFVYATCCGGDPTVVECGENVDIGHPGHGPFGDATCPGDGKGGGKS
jgi:type II secretory pathway pseudopilin PulG